MNLPASVKHIHQHASSYLPHQKWIYLHWRKLFLKMCFSIYLTKNLAASVKDVPQYAPSYLPHQKWIYLHWQKIFLKMCLHIYFTRNQPTFLTLSPCFPHQKWIYLHRWKMFLSMRLRISLTRNGRSMMMTATGSSRASASCIAPTAGASGASVGVRYTVLFLASSSDTEKINKI